jgi:predicted nucleic-acid-binding Zn-ribbon protein
MIKSKTCPKCGGTKIAGPHKLYGGNRHLCVDLPGISTATLESFTCSECGYTEFYADKIGLRNIRSSGRFILNPRMGASQVPRRCPNCGAKTRPGSSYCHECAIAFS